GSALDDVVLPVAADDDRAQTHSGPAGTIDEDACQETADAAESVEDDVADFALAGLGIDDLGEFLSEECLDVGIRALELLDEAAQVDPCRRQVEFGQCLHDAVGDLDVEVLAEEVASIA